MLTFAIGLFLVVIALIAIGLIVKGVRDAQARTRDLGSRSSDAEATFEQSLLEEFGEADTPSAEPVPIIDEPIRVPDDVLRRLEAIGLVAGRDGKVVLSEDGTKGLALRLSSGESALILPQLECAEDMSRYTRGYDRTFTILPDGEVAVSQRLPQFISDNMGSIG